MEGAQVPVTVPLSAPCPTCRGTGAKPAPSRRSARAARAAASRPSPRACSRSRSRAQCGGTGTEIKDPCPTCHGTGQDPPGQALPGEHPRPGVRDGIACGWPARARRAARRSLRRPLRDHARGRLPDLQAQGRQPRGRGADHDPRGDPRGDRSRCRRCRPPSASACPPARSTAPCSGCAARARRSSAAAAAATSTTGSWIDVPSSLSKEQTEVVDELAEVMNGNPREACSRGGGDRRRMADTPDRERPAAST